MLKGGRKKEKKSDVFFLDRGSYLLKSKLLIDLSGVK